MSRVLVLFDHPAFERSRVHRRLVEHFRAPLPGITSEQVTLAATLEVRSSVFFATAIVLLVFARHGNK